MVQSQGEDAILMKQPPTGKAPLRLLLVADPGWGKSTFGAEAPGATILMARGETGYETLAREGRAPKVPSSPVETWRALMWYLGQLKPKEHGTLVLDALGGFDRLCDEHVCTYTYGGVWEAASGNSFMSYHKGFKVSAREWCKMIDHLERLHCGGTGIIILSHPKVRTFKNPMGEDFDQFQPDCHEEKWNALTKWVDTVLFGTFRIVVDPAKIGKKSKGIGGRERVVYTEHSDAYIAKNRSGLPSEIDVPDDHINLYSYIAAYLDGTATQSQPESQPEF